MQKLPPNKKKKKIKKKKKSFVEGHKKYKGS